MRLLRSPELGLLVEPVSEQQKAAAQQQGQGQVLQFMMSFTMQDWADMKQLVPAGSCVMPHRGASSSRAGARPDAEDVQPAKRARRS